MTNKVINLFYYFQTSGLGSQKVYLSFKKTYLLTHWFWFE